MGGAGQTKGEGEVDFVRTNIEQRVMPAAISKGS